MWRGLFISSFSASARGDAGAVRSQPRRATVYDAVLMLRLLVLQALHTLSDEQMDYQLHDRLSFMRFVGLALHDPMPNAMQLLKPGPPSPR